MMPDPFVKRQAKEKQEAQNKFYMENFSQDLLVRNI